MYVSTIARSLGNLGILPRRLPPPKKPCVSRCYVDPKTGMTVCVDCGHPGGLGTTAACSDAGTGLLIDCWRQAESRGMGIALDQEQLSRAATTYQRLMRPGSLAGWVKSGNRMVWKSSGLGSYRRRRGGMGDDSLLVDNFDSDLPGAGGSWAGPQTQTPIMVPPSYITPPDPLAIAQSQPSKPPDMTKWFPPVVPAVTPQFLLQAASLPNAPAAVKAAAASPAVQAAAAQQASTLNFGWLTQQAISGIPNYALLGASVVVLLMLSKRR